jgi:hypothetical protein
MKLRATILLILTTLGLGLAVLVSPATPAWACSCVSGGQDERADFIVVGTVASVTDTAVHLAVEFVEKGTPGAGATLALKTGRSESGCGYGFRVGTRYRVHSTDGATGLCSGISELPGRPSTPAAIATTDAVAPRVAAGQAASASGWLWFAAGAAVTVLAAGLIAVAMRRRRTG